MPVGDWKQWAKEWPTWIGSPRFLGLHRLKMEGLAERGGSRTSWMGSGRRLPERSRGHKEGRARQADSQEGAILLGSTWPWLAAIKHPQAGLRRNASLQRWRGAPTLILHGCVKPLGTRHPKRGAGSSRTTSCVHTVCCTTQTRVN
jgi:hypothetical protein